MINVPFRGSDALSSGELTRNDLRRRFRPLFRDVYLSRDIELTAVLKARAAWLSTGATLAGISAAAVFGTKWLNANAPAEIVRAERHAQRKMISHSYELTDDEVCLAKGMRVTTPARAGFDIGRRLPADQSVPILDALLNVTGVKPADIEALVDRHRGTRGVKLLRGVLNLVDGGAESPQETRVRLLLIAAGLPNPETQIQFRDLHIRVDMGWREWKVAVEYDGIQHWTDGRQRSWDIERIAMLESMGWTVIRISAEMLRRPQAIVDRVGTALISRGCPKTW